MHCFEQNGQGNNFAVAYGTGEEWVGWTAEQGVQLKGDKWQHVAVVIDNFEIRIAVDGEVKRTIQSPKQMVHGNAIFRIGHSYKGFSGAVEAFRVYQGALSQQEILELIV